MEWFEIWQLLESRCWLVCRIAAVRLLCDTLLTWEKVIPCVFGSPNKIGLESPLVLLQRSFAIKVELVRIRVDSSIPAEYQVCELSPTAHYINF